MYSRLEHNTRRRLLLQSFGALGLTVLISALFLVVVLPGFIRILGSRAKSLATETRETTVLPRPFLAQPFDATSSASIALTGTAQAGEKIILLQNGAPGPEATADDAGSFRFDTVTLEAGSNTFAAVSENSAGERSNPSNQVRIAYLKDAPKLEILEPENGKEITQRKQNPITVKGKTDSGNRIYINDKMQFVAADGSFSSLVQLSEGENPIIIRAVNSAAIETISELSVRFSP